MNRNEDLGLQNYLGDIKIGNNLVMKLFKGHLQENLGNAFLKKKSLNRNEDLGLQNFLGDLRI